MSQICAIVRGIIDTKTERGRRWREYRRGKTEDGKSGERWNMACAHADGLVQTASDDVEFVELKTSHRRGVPEQCSVSLTGTH
jgi:hypothetical protein